MAQLGARFHGMEEVEGSSPSRSTNLFNDLAPVDGISCGHVHTYVHMEVCLAPESITEWH